MPDFWNFPRNLRPRSDDSPKGLHRVGADELAGWSLALDMWGVGCRPLTDETSIMKTLIRAAEEDGAVVREQTCYRFGTGVFATVVLETGHISIRTWPENGILVVDAFSPLAGGKKLGVLRTHFRPEGIYYTETERGSLVRGEIAKKASQKRG
jgi:S-adenosylmethionine/arginine decarboxylase-like enzyme